MVHSSLSKIGWVCGAEVSVIQALLEVVGEEGTIVMPAHTGDNSDPSVWENPPIKKEWLDTLYDSMPAFDKEITPTRGMGRIAETFRKFPNTHRSDHPQVSFCTNGKDAESIVKKHLLTPQFGLNTPLGTLYQMEAKVLLLGVSYSNCTSFHLAECLTNKMNFVKMSTAMKVDGEREWVEFEDIDYNCDDFEEIGLQYERQSHRVIKGKVGQADCKLFEMKPAVDYATKWMLKYR